MDEDFVDAVAGGASIGAFGVESDFLEEPVDKTIISFGDVQRDVHFAVGLDMFPFGGGGADGLVAFLFCDFLDELVIVEQQARGDPGRLLSKDYNLFLV